MKTDGQVQIMYWLFKKHHMRPLDFFNMNIGEKTVIEAFVLQEIDDIKEENRRMKGG